MNLIMLYRDYVAVI